MLQQIITIARNTFIESIRQPIFFVLVMLAILLQVVNTWTAAFSMGYSSSAEVYGDNKLLLDIGMGTVFVFGMLLAAFSATAVVSREIENRTVLTVVSKPVARPSLVLGKFTGVAGAIILGVIVMLAALLLGLRHGVMSTAADDPDGPVILFSLVAIALSLGLAVWGNFMYGWYFSQTCMIVLMPAMVVAYLLVLAVDKHWDFQPLSADFKPQVTTACLTLSMAIMVLTAAATAVSTRLGQVMTIVVCAGIFLLGLLSNHLFGRRAFTNDALGVVEMVQPLSGADEGLATSGATYTVTLDVMPRTVIPPGSSFRYGPSPSGFPLFSPAFEPFQGDAGRTEQLFAAAPALIITEAAGRSLTVRNIGRQPVPVTRPPEPGDYVFTEQTRINPAYLAVWGVVPNMQFFWLLDAVSQNRPVPTAHLALAAAYAASQVGAFLALGVVLFQRRDVG